MEFIYEDRFGLAGEDKDLHVLQSLKMHSSREIQRLIKSVEYTRVVASAWAASAGGADVDRVVLGAKKRSDLSGVPILRYSDRNQWLHFLNPPMR